MKRNVILIVALLTFAMIALAIKATAIKGLEDTKKKKVEKVKWNTFDKGFELAQKEKKLLVVDFYTDWCHWCKVMDKETYGNQEVIDFTKDNVIMAKVNAETNDKVKFKDTYYSGRELSLMFGVRGFPTTVFLNTEGELITKVSGFIPADRFIMILKYLAGNWHEKMKFDEFVKKEEQKSKS